MGRKKKSGDDGLDSKTIESSSQPSTSKWSASAPQPSSASKNSLNAINGSKSAVKLGKKDGGKATPTTPSSPAPLIICRNKHWRYIACFHGPWLHMPIEILETMANVNYQSPRPRQVDPAVFFDIIKIRKLIEEATDLAVRAASDVSSQKVANGNNSAFGRDAASLGLGLGGGGHTLKLSPERKFRMNLQACQKLAHAYRLDEIACSVATMQGASTLDGIATKVLQKNSNDMDGKYVHFFHEKIPSRQLAENTSLEPLDDIIDDASAGAEALRTRAMIKGLMLDFLGAARDFTRALEVHAIHGMPHRAPTDGATSAEDETRPSSLVPQLYFMRACAYLTVASDKIRDSFWPLWGPEPAAIGATAATTAATAKHEQGQHQHQHQHQHDDQGGQEQCKIDVAEAQKSGKNYARKALKDYLTFLSHFEYTPHLPPETFRGFNDRIGQAASGSKNPKPGQGGGGGGRLAPEKIYKLSELFSVMPRNDLPPFPPEDLSCDAKPPLPGDLPTAEAVTYHPLLTEAIHSVLLCHVILQTTRTELLRHAYNVARIARLVDAYPIFQASRSVARADWVSILDAWQDHDQPLKLAHGFTWEQLCAPAPLPKGPGAKEPTPSVPAATPTPTLMSVPATGPASAHAISSLTLQAPQEPEMQRAMTRWSVADDGKEFPMVTDRALILGKWIKDAPFVAVGPKRRRKKKEVGKTSEENGGPEEKKKGGGGG